MIVSNAMRKSGLADLATTLIWDGTEGLGLTFLGYIRNKKNTGFPERVYNLENYDGNYIARNTDMVEFAEVALVITDGEDPIIIDMIEKLEAKGVPYSTYRVDIRRKKHG